MAFLAPLWLSLAALAAVPVLLHLLRRNIGARMEFPAVRYLLSAERDASKDVRAKNLLLLLLRILIVLALALAAARPVWTRGEGTPRALAIVLDNSASTTAVVDGAPVLDRLTAAARELRASAASAEQVWLVTADGRRFTGPEAVDAALARVVPLPSAGVLDEAVRTATALAQNAAGSSGAVAIVTDGQQSAWTKAVPPGTVRIRAFVPTIVPPPNGAILSAVAQPQWWTPRGTLELTVQPVRDTTAYRVAIGDNTLSRGVIIRQPGDSIATLRIPLLGSGAGWKVLDVSIEPSGVGADDHASIPIVVGAAPAVNDAAGPFAAAAIGTLRESGRVRSGSGAVTIAPATAVNTLPAMILPPTDAGGLAAANASLARLGIPWRFGAEERGTQLVRSAHGDLRGDTAVRAMRWFPLLPLNAAATGDTVAQLGSTVWMVRGPKWIVLGSPLDPASTTLPVRAAFVPWLADAISNLASGTSAASVVQPFTLFEPRGGVTTLLVSDGVRRASIGTGPMRAPLFPGVYYLTRGADTVTALHVPLGSAEPRLARAPTSELLTMLGGADRAMISATPDAFVRSVKTAGASQSLSLPLLVLAALALLAEAWVSGRYKAGAAPSLATAR